MFIPWIVIPWIVIAYKYSPSSIFDLQCIFLRTFQPIFPALNSLDSLSRYHRLYLFNCTAKTSILEHLNSFTNVGDEGLGPDVVYFPKRLAIFSHLSKIEVQARLKSKAYHQNPCAIYLHGHVEDCSGRRNKTVWQ